MRKRWSGRPPHVRAGAAGVLAAVLIAPAVSVLALPASPALAAGCDTLGFTPGPVTEAAAQPRDIEVADSNHDGFDDLLIADASGDGDVRQFVAIGNGGFWPGSGPQAPPEVYPTSGSPNNIAVGFFNDDAEPDFAAATTAGVSLWFGSSGGDVRYGPGGRLLDGRNIPDVAVVDADRDLRSDIAVLDPAAGELKVFKNLNGAGSFDERFLISHPKLFVGPTYLAAGDLTGNGVPDYVFSSFAGNSVTVLRNTSENRSPRLTGLDNAWKPVLADFDLDQNLDMAVAFPNDDKVRVWRGSNDPKDRTAPPMESGSLLTELPPVDLAPLTTGSAVPNDVDVADLNGDGRPDLVVVGAGSHAVYAYLGNGDGTFGAPLALTAGSRPVQAAIGHFDNNQSLDIVVADEVDGTVRTYLNTCTAPGPNLTVTGMEATQVIQDLANSVDLIADRRTVVRAYVGTTVASPAVTATLQAFRPDGTAVGVPLRPSNPGEALAPDPKPRRGQLDGGFLFELPPAWTVAGDLTLRLEVNPDHRVVEPEYGDNVRTQTVHFNESNPVKVELVKFGYKKNGQWVLPPDSRLDAVESLLRRALPAARIIVTRSEQRDDYPYFWISENGTYYTDGADANSVLGRFKQTTAGTRRPGVIYVVLVERKEMGGIAEDIPGWVAVSGQEAPIALHEVGHLLGRYHVECTPYANDEGGAAPFPYPGGSIGGPDPGNPSFAGFDQGDASLGLPQHVVWAPDGDPVVGDVMSYCSQRWPSDVTYEAWRARIQSVFSAADPTGDLLALGGTINPAAGTATLTGQRIPQAAYVPARQPGPYALRLLDAGGATLAEHAFTPLPAGEDGQGLGFDEVVEFAPGTRRVALVDTATGSQLAALAISAGRPAVSLTGEPLPDTLPASGSVPVSWTASDPDGDPVTASLLYSADGGQNWTVLASGLTGGSYTVDTSTLPGTGGAATGRLRVRVSDGVNTADATSGPLTVGGKAPTVRITAPLRGAAFAQGQTVLLAATAGDLEQGTLGDNQISWSSNIDGDLGTGSVIAPEQLSAGSHTITVTATDRDGSQATAQTVVTVGRTVPAGSPPVADAGPDQSAVEGGTVTLDAAGTTDPDGDAVTLAWSVLAQPASAVLGASVRLEGPAERPSFQAVESGTYRLRLTATDARHGTSTDDVTVTVANDAPVLTITAPAENALLPVGSATVQAAFADPGVLDTHTCTVEWDVDQATPPVPGTVTEQAGAGTCTAARLLTVGVYSVRVTVTDDEGAVAQATRQIVVYDPTAGFVTGGGWITSPAGACPAKPTATGAATFGFVSRYKKGDSTPSGETDFRLAVGDLHFSGTAYEWLVVSGAKAQYRGTGTVNDRAGYSFLVTVGDGQERGGDGVDRFRIKIWQTDTGAVVYDNVPGAPDDIDSANPQAIAKGSIVIHK